MDWLEKARREKEEAERQKALEQGDLEKWFGEVRESRILRRIEAAAADIMKTTYFKYIFDPEKLAVRGAFGHRIYDRHLFSQEPVDAFSCGCFSYKVFSVAGDALDWEKPRDSNFFEIWISSQGVFLRGKPRFGHDRSGPDQGLKIDPSDITDEDLVSWFGRISRKRRPTGRPGRSGSSA